MSENETIELPFVQLPLKKFLAVFPEYVPFVRMNNIDDSDDEYIVRFSPRGVEFGYPSDTWVLFPDSLRHS